MKSRKNLKSTEEERIVFQYTDGYLKKRKLMQILCPIVCIVVYILAPFSMEFIHNRLLFSAVMLLLIVFSLIFLYKYGKPFTEYEKDDIYIKNNRIYYKRHTKTKFGGGTDNVEINNIRRVSVKKCKIVIYGEFKERSLNVILPYKKLVVPMEIENVEEFIRFAKSRVGKE